MKEVWKKVKGYEEYYKVSNLGNIKNIPRIVHIEKYSYKTKEKIIKTHIDQKGYLRVNLRYENNKNLKVKRVHQIVAEAFLNHSPCGMKLVVDHIDNNIKNNNVENLRLVSNRENLSNRKKRGTSKYTGVTWNKSRECWQSHIYYNGKLHYLGDFVNEELAKKSYDYELIKISKHNFSL